MADTSLASTNTPLTSLRARADYSPIEREFSQVLQTYLGDLLEGRRKRLPFFRKYPQDPARLGVIPVPDGMPLQALELSRIEQLTWEALNWLHTGAVGGPIAQTIAADGSTVELQTFTTRCADIVIERVDHFPPGAAAADSISWCLSRMQAHPSPGLSSVLIAAANVLLGLVELAN